MPPPSQSNNFVRGGLLGVIFILGFRMVAFWLRDDSGRLDTIFISPFVTRALEPYHMGFGRKNGDVYWSSLMMDIVWYVYRPAFRLRPSLNAASLRFRFSLASNHSSARKDRWGTRCPMRCRGTPSSGRNVYRDAAIPSRPSNTGPTDLIP